MKISCCVKLKKLIGKKGKFLLYPCSRTNIFIKNLFQYWGNISRFGETRPTQYVDLWFRESSGNARYGWNSPKAIVWGSMMCEQIIGPFFYWAEHSSQCLPRFIYRVRCTAIGWPANPCSASTKWSTTWLGTGSLVIYGRSVFAAMEMKRPILMHAPGFPDVTQPDFFSLGLRQSHWY